MDFRKRMTADRDGTGLGEGNAALAVNRARNSLGDATPKIDGQTIAGPDNIIGASGKVDRKIIQIGIFVAQNLQTKSLALGVDFEEA